MRGVLWTLVLVLAGCATPALAQTSTTSSAKSADKTEDKPTVTAGRDGFVVRSADGAFQLRLRGYTQFDGRFFLDDNRPTTTSGFLLRRVRPIIEATLYKYFDVRLMPDFSGGSATLFDAYADLRLKPELVVRAGKFKPPIGLGRLQPAADLVFVERGMPINLVPNRDVGLEAYGQIRGGVVGYEAGVFNGAADLANSEADNNNAKDVAGRIFLHPFRKSGHAPIAGLGVGLAASRGLQRGVVGASFLPGYRTPAQQTVFAYRPDVVADGQHMRLSPQGYWYYGRVGILAEYIRSIQSVRRDVETASLAHSAYGVEGSYVISGEAPSYRGGVSPKHPFDPAKHTWGAFEAGFRVGRLTPDEDTFPIYSDTATQVTRATSWGTTFNWYLVRGIKVQVNYDRTTFVGGAATGDRETEQVLATRVQHSF